MLKLCENADVFIENYRTDAISKHGRTPLDFAIMRGQEEAVETLRKHGGKTGVELKAAQPDPPTAKAPAISIHDAATEGNIEAVRQHLAAGTDVNAKLGGRTSLHLAAYEGQKEIAELLIANGADVNAKDKRGTTPLHEVAGRGHNKDVAELLIAKGADVNAKDDNGWKIGRASCRERV